MRAHSFLKWMAYIMFIFGFGYSQLWESLVAYCFCVFSKFQLHWALTTGVMCVYRHTAFLNEHQTLQDHICSSYCRICFQIWDSAFLTIIGPKTLKLLFSATRQWRNGSTFIPKMNDVNNVHFCNLLLRTLGVSCCIVFLHVLKISAALGT